MPPPCCLPPGVASATNPVAATAKVADDCDDLQEEVCQLEQKLKEKQTELFQIQRNSYRRKRSLPKKKEYSFVRPQRIILQNSIETLKRTLELNSMLTSTEVSSYVAGEHCCVVFHMQHASEHVMSHGLRIDMMSGKNEITKKSLPLGFNLSAAMEAYDNAMTLNCLGSIRKALVAYYDRLEQFDKLKKLVKPNAELFKVLDGSRIKISFYLQGSEGQGEGAEGEEQDVEVHIPVALQLHYRVHDIRPKTYAVEEFDDPDLKQQCAIFKKKPLHVAFEEVFMSEFGQFKLVKQWESREVGSGLPGRRRERKRPHQRLRPLNPHHDDTFRPEDCSDQGEECDDGDEHIHD